MNCADTVALINAEIDHELPPEESQAVLAHLSSCPECERRYALLRDAREAFRLLAADPAARPRSVMTAALLAAAVVATIVVGIVMVRSPAPQGGRDASAAIDCGVPGSASCVVVTPPCAGRDCGLVLVLQ